MARQPASVKLEPELIKRLERLGKVDRRSVSNLIELCVVAHLPKLEAEILTPKLQEDPAPYGKSPQKK